MIDAIGKLKRTEKINPKLRTNAIGGGKRGPRKKRKPIGYAKIEKKKLNTKKIFTLIRKQGKYLF
jgi:hypothetical protein